MRLSEFEKESIKKVAGIHFGKDAKVFLFGSRTNMQERGGDIDLYICNPNNEHLKVRAKIDFLTDLYILIGEQRIDVVLDNPDLKKSIFFKKISQTGVQLC